MMFNIIMMTLRLVIWLHIESPHMDHVSGFPRSNLWVARLYVYLSEFVRYVNLTVGLIQFM